MTQTKTPIDLPSFFQQLKKSAESVLMIDYDGTISPFTIHRDEAFPYPGVVEKLKEIISLSHTRVILVTGRALDGVIPLIGDLAPLIELWGSHGLERKMPGQPTQVQEVEEQVSKGIKEGIEATKSCVRPEHIEIKTMGVAVHWRGLEQSEKEYIQHSIISSWESITQDYPVEILIFSGGIEMRAEEFHKGKAVETVLSEVKSDATIAYLGDDFTDEDAFASLGSRGFKVLVREEKRKTLADFHLKPPQELLHFLDQWIQYGS